MTNPSGSAANPAPPVVIAVLPDGGSDAVMRRAIDLARETDAGLILYDAAAGNRLLEDPLPNRWSAHGEEEQFGDRLTPNDLEAAGRAPLARLVREARDAGIQAWACRPTRMPRRSASTPPSRELAPSSSTIGRSWAARFGTPAIFASRWRRRTDGSARPRRRDWRDLPRSR